MSNVVAAHKEKHEFALHIQSLSALVQKKGPGSTVIFSDEKLFHRMVTVLRLTINDSCVFFDRDLFIAATVAAFKGKKEVHVLIQSVQPTNLLYPKITFLLPMLKRDDYETALYALAEAGVTDIQLVFTKKTGNQWVSSRDSDRAQRILIAAAEQSKNFAYPQLRPPISLDVALKQNSEAAIKIFFDPQGKSFFDVMNVLHNNHPKDIVLLVGPEGDLSLEEKKMVRENNFIFCALTPTIMRAVQAAAVAACFVRSLLVSASR